MKSFSSDTIARILYIFIVAFTHKNKEIRWKIVPEHVEKETKWHFESLVPLSACNKIQMKLVW